MVLLRPVTQRGVKTRNATADLIGATHVAGDAVIAFTLIYCSLNWNQYRSVRLRHEEEEEERDAKERDAKERKDKGKGTGKGRDDDHE